MSAGGNLWSAPMPDVLGGDMGSCCFTSAYLLRCQPCRVDIDIKDLHNGTLLCEEGRDLFADTASAARNDGNLVV